MDPIFDDLGFPPAMISLHSSTHSSQMKTLNGPEINLLTSCCDLKQKVQYRTFVGTGTLAASGVAISAWAELDT